MRFERRLANAMETSARSTSSTSTDPGPARPRVRERPYLLADEEIRDSLSNLIKAEF
jgi:hypothetical protein